MHILYLLFSRRIPSIILAIREPYSVVTERIDQRRESGVRIWHAYRSEYHVEWHGNVED